MVRPSVLALGLAALIAIQTFFYASYVQREVAWNYVLHGDPTWYTMLCYRLFDAMANGDWGAIGRLAKDSPWGAPLFLEAGLTQLIFGRGRLGVVSINLIYFVAAQLATFFFFRRVSASAWGGTIAVVMLLAMQTPFRGDGVGLNIGDFHFDLVLFCLLLCIIYLVGRSDTFRHRGWAILVGVLAAVTVATRLVSVFLLVGVFGTLLLWLLWRAWRDVPDRLVARARALNVTIAGLVFCALVVVPLVIARKALYNHYFRFVFDREFSETKTSLYSMGSSKLTEAWQLIRRMFAYDFAWPYLVAFLLLLVLAGLGWRAAGRATFRPEQEEARRTFVSFLLIAMVVSYVMHLVFPIQSDHLTRITAAPIFVLGMLLTVRPAVAALRAASVGRIAAVAATAAMMVVAGFVQLRFYTGEGRYADQKAELIKVADLYADISRIVHARDLRGVSLSVDVFRDFELGAMLSYISYEYERHGRFVDPAAKLGDKIDTPISRADAMVEISQSDFVLLEAGPYGDGGRWPMMRSIATFREDLVDRVRTNFCLVSRHTIGGRSKELYARPQAWKMTASGQRNRSTGPERLLAGGQQTWTVRWTPGSEQWVEFEAARPVTIASLGIQVPRKKSDQAPAALRLDAVDEDGSTMLLSVSDVGLDDAGQAEWAVAAPKPARRYRLTVSGIEGDSGWLSIQKLWTTLHDLPCEVGRPYS